MSLPARSWRTAFLTLRDETSASPPEATILIHLNQLILSNSDSLIAAASELPPHEVTSDLILLLELAQSVSHSQGIEDVTLAFSKLSHLIQGVSRRAFLQLNSTSWTLAFDTFKRIVQALIGNVKNENAFTETACALKYTKQCIQSIRTFFDLYQAASSLSENEQLLSFLLHVAGCFRGDSMYSSDVEDNDVESGYNRGIEVLTVLFSMIAEVYSRVGSSIPVDIWQSTIAVLREVMDLFTPKSRLVKDDCRAMFYVELLHCLHLVLIASRGSVEGNVSGFVAVLKNFLRYGLLNKPHLMNQVRSHMTPVGSTSRNLQFAQSSRPRSGAYKPPHLRKKVVESMQQKDKDSSISPEHGSSSTYLTSSDSECSDSERSVIDNSSIQFAKARLAAIVCIQDLCRADPKLFTAQWTMLLPSSDVLQNRHCETTLMSCLLFDPSLKVRTAAGTTITAMLDGPVSVFLQVAEFREPFKRGSFTALSSSLGHTLMQLHSGVLYLIKNETHSRLLGLSFKILMLLIPSTPYSRMPEELLSTVISSVNSRIEEGFSFQSDQTNLLVAAFNCLTIALSASPSKHVHNLLLTEISRGSLKGQLKSGVLNTLFQYCKQSTSPSISIEAFQALKALAHNYPNVVALCWDQVSSVVQLVLSSSVEVTPRSRRDHFEFNVEAIKERLITAAIKVLDESLRAISGFKGTEDISNDKFLDNPFITDYVKTKAISSAPCYTFDSSESTEDESKSCKLASERWFESTVKHMPITIKHSSAMVRAASVTCFAGITSSVFDLLPEDKQYFIIHSSIDTCLRDEVPSVRSAACRAIGVIACFPKVYHSTEVLEKCIHAAEHNTRDSLVSVRITASWALANMCDSLGHYMNGQDSGMCSAESWKSSQFVLLLVNSALRLARDNDKVKANAVRALGNVSRFVKFTRPSVARDDPENSLCIKFEYNDIKPFKDEKRERLDSFESPTSGNLDWLQKMVQAFLSCVATGNVKVQWNVCHALSNLFFNKSLKLKDMSWASAVFSILLLLLRDSSNFKIKIQAAAALAVPKTIDDYGGSYYDVVKGVQHVVENFNSDQISAPSNFKYWVALDKQLTSTMLHLLGLASKCTTRDLQDFLINKASFLEAWIRNLCTSLGYTNNSVEDVKHIANMEEKKDVICKTIRSLVSVFESCNQHPIAHRFDRLTNILV